MGLENNHTRARAILYVLEQSQLPAKSALTRAKKNANGSKTSFLQPS